MPPRGVWRPQGGTPPPGRDGGAIVAARRTPSRRSQRQRERSGAPAARRLARIASLAAAFAAAAPLGAQGGIVAGTVLNDRAAPLPGGQITVGGTQNGALSDAACRFRITGVAGAPERRAIGNVVTSVSAAEVAATQPVQHFQWLLTGRASGVSIVGSSGQVGTGSRIRIRRALGLSLDDDPLIYVDGVRVDDEQASGPTNQAFGSASVSRWNDCDPDDIESIETIEGPAAATLYGTEASNGVIQIIRSAALSA